jgi:hypothetical protein
MEREFLRNLGLTKEQEDAIMEEHGKTVKTHVDGKNTALADLNKANEKLATVADYDAIKSELETLRAGQPEVDKELKELRDYKTGREYGDRFTAVVGDKKFVNDVTREHAFGKFTAAVADPANEGKTDSDIFAAVIEGKDAEWFASKVGIMMTPSNPHADPNQHTSSVKLIPHTN